MVCDYGTVETPLPIPNREVKHSHADDSFGKNRSSQTFFCVEKYLQNFIVNTCHSNDIFCCSGIINMYNYNR